MFGRKTAYKKGATINIVYFLRPKRHRFDRSKKGLAPECMRARWTARNPMLLLALPLLLFAENNPAFELLFELPPRIDHGLSASTKFELSEPHDWSLLVTD